MSRWPAVQTRMNLHAFEREQKCLRCPRWAPPGSFRGRRTCADCRASDVARHNRDWRARCGLKGYAHRARNAAGRFVPLVLVLFLSGCGMTTSNPPETCGDDWKRYDIAPGACLAAFSGGVDWQEFTTQPDRGHGVDQQFLSPGIGVDCSDAPQFGLTMRATDEPLSVEIKASAGTVEEYAAGDPACGLMVPQIDRF